MGSATTSFNIEAAGRITGVTERQIRYWDKTGLVPPSVRAAEGRGSQRLYSFADLLELRVIARLRQAGLSLQSVRQVAGYLRRHHRELQRPLSQLRLITDGVTVFRLSSDTAALEDTLRAGQTVFFVVNLASVWNETQSGVLRISDHKAVAIRQGGRTYAVTLTPDLEDGGWVAECAGLPGCVSQGDTLGEAKRMIREAIRAWLLATEDQQSAKDRGLAQRSRR